MTKGDPKHWERMTLQTLIWPCPGLDATPYGIWTMDSNPRLQIVEHNRLYRGKRFDPHA